MPELPEVETLRRRWARRAPRAPVRGVATGAAHLFRGGSARAVRDAVLGQVPGPAVRHGKAMFVRFGERWLLLHFGMDGGLAFGGEPEHAGLRLRFADGRTVAYTTRRLLGLVRIVPSPQAWVAQQGLGPDALGLGPGVFAQRLHAGRGAVKARLLDQGVLAGVGNLYADEACFQARVHPASPVALLDDADLLRIHVALQRALRRAIAAGAEAERYPRTWLWHHRAPGEPCPRCRAPLRFTRVAGRGTWLCPEEQRLPAGAPR